MEVEDAFISECRKQGVQPSPDVMRRFAVDLAGSVINDQNFVLPGRLSLAVRDCVASFRSTMPEGFSSLEDHPPPSINTESLTDQMMRELRQQRGTGLPSDWNEVRAKYKTPGNRTAEMMDIIRNLRLKR